MKLKADHFAWQEHSPAVWLHTHPWSCMHTIRQPTVCLASFKPVASEAQSSTRPLFPPTLFSPISLTPNFSLLWSDYRHVYPPCLHLPPLFLSLSVSASLQVLVAFISFSETMLLVYLSYKVSYSRRTVGKKPSCDVPRLWCWHVWHVWASMQFTLEGGGICPLCIPLSSAVWSRLKFFNAVG